jgi:hypothetical protein
VLDRPDFLHAAERPRVRERLILADRWVRLPLPHNPVSSRSKVYGRAPNWGMVSLLDGIDAESVDDRADELIDLCRLHPEVAGRRRGLARRGHRTPARSLFEALSHLHRAGRLDPDRLLDAAVRGLSECPMNHAPELVVEQRDGLAPGQLRPAFPAIARLAAPMVDFGPRPAPDLRPLRVAVAHDLPALLDELQVLIDPEPHRRRIGAGAAARL